jgi:hypothetical protein
MATHHNVIYSLVYVLSALPHRADWWGPECYLFGSPLPGLLQHCPFQSGSPVSTCAFLPLPIPPILSLALDWQGVVSQHMLLLPPPLLCHMSATIQAMWSLFCSVSRTPHCPAQSSSLGQVTVPPAFHVMLPSNFIAQWDSISSVPQPSMLFHSSVIFPFCLLVHFENSLSFWYLQFSRCESIYKNATRARPWWLTPVILATQEEVISSKPAQANSSWDPISKKPITRRIPRWWLEVGSRKRSSYSEILERRWRQTLQA